MDAHINSLVHNMRVKRHMLFVSLSSKDKKIALPLVGKLEDLQINYWCMYDRNGKERNISGDVYTEVISKNLSKCCVFLLLLSKASLSSNEVKREINEVKESVRIEKHSHLKIIPILLNDTKEEDIPEEIVKLSGITTEVIVRRLDENTTDEEINDICAEINAQYDAAVFENILLGFQKVKDANVFQDIMDKCIKSKCSINTIGETIKNSKEVFTDSLRELHIISNEVLDFDCNPLACMVISSNLLGTYCMKDGKKIYNPQKSGVRYFYYFPESISQEFTYTKNKIRSYLLKDENSRIEVANSLRKDFCNRNKITKFFLDFNNMTQKEFANYYHIVDEKSLAEFNELFSQENVQVYFDYSDNDNIFQIPDEFITWLDGATADYSFENIFAVSSQFIEFLGNFVELLKTVEDINSVSFEALVKHYQYLIKLQTFDRWQLGLIRLSIAESKRLTNYLLDYTVSSVDRKMKKYPKLAEWLSFTYDDKKAPVVPDGALIEAALANMIAIPLNENDELKLCYSFELFIEDSVNTGMWYSVERFDAAQIDHMVISQEVTNKTSLYYELLKAFRYLMDTYPDAKTILEDNHSRLLKIKC